MKEAILRSRSRSGSVMVIVTISLMTLVGIAAMVIDIGLLYVAKQRAQDTADACAVSGLAGETVFVRYSGLCGPLVMDKVRNEVTNGGETGLFDLMNSRVPPMGADPSTVVPTVKDRGTITPPAGEGPSISFDSTLFAIPPYEYLGSLAVQVDCSIPVDLTFAGIFGLSQKTVVGKAVALLSHPPDMNYAFAPWAVTSTVLVGGIVNGTPPAKPALRVGESVTMTLTNSGGTLNEYGFTAIALNGETSLGSYGSRLQGPSTKVTLSSDFGKASPFLGINGDVVSILDHYAGMNAETDTALNARFAGDPDYATWSSAGNGGSYPDSNRIVVVPVVDRSSREIKGFAPFFIENFNASAGAVTCRLLSATYTGNRLRWGRKQRLSANWLNQVSRIRLFDSRTTLTD